MTSKFEEAFNGAHGFIFDRFKFDEPCYEMLIIEDEDQYLEHLRVQAAGLAYYTMVARNAAKDYEDLDRKVKFRYNEMYKHASDALIGRNKKATIRDIEIELQITFRKELDDMYEELKEARDARDYAEAFLKGWEQKSYQLSNMTDMITAGLLTPKETVTEEDMENQRRLVREIASKRSQAKKRDQEEQEKETPEESEESEEQGI